MNELIVNQKIISCKISLTPLHWTSFNDRASTCKLLCALDGVDFNAVNDEGDTALDLAIRHAKVDSVRALLELNVDARKARVAPQTKVEIVQLLNEHRNRSVKNIIITFLCLKVKFVCLLLFFCRKLNGSC